jgi:hypothetical protein
MGFVTIAPFLFIHLSNELLYEVNPVRNFGGSFLFFYSSLAVIFLLF